jgi:hypothetical protein
MPRFYRIQTGLFRKYLFSLDHKVIGLQYALTSLIFLLIGFGLAIVFRWQLAYPGKAVPLVGSLFGELNAPGASCVLAAEVIRTVRLPARPAGPRLAQLTRKGTRPARREFEWRGKYFAQLPRATGRAKMSRC